MLLHRVTNAVTSAVPRKRPSRVRIFRTDGDGAADEIPLPHAGVVVGADPGCDVPLDDRAISSRHVSIVPSDAGFEATDLGSRNGTWLEGGIEDSLLRRHAGEGRRHPGRRRLREDRLRHDERQARCHREVDPSCCVRGRAKKQQPAPKKK